MKTIKITQCFLTFMALVTIISCVSDDDFTVPDLTITEPNIEDDNIITIGALANAYEQELIGLVSDLGFESGDFGYERVLEETRATFVQDLGDEDKYIEGYVVSSDEFGNWFEEIIIQDSAEAPTKGIRILIDESPLFTSYEIGRKIFVKLNGLHLGNSNGVLSLGVTDNLEKIPAPLQLDYIQRSTIVETIVPVQTTIARFNKDLENIFVQLTDVQFIKDEVLDASLTFAGEPLDEFDGERTLFSCESRRRVIVSSSTFADFASIQLPVGKGSISGILSRNFFGDTFNFVINDINDISFDDETRCDPVEIDCGIDVIVGTTILFEDFFETQSTGSLISGNGWTNFQEAGTESWEAFTGTGQNPSLGISVAVGSFSSGDDSTIAWLVTPEVDYTAQEGETLQFQTSNSFADGSTLDILFSGDWDGVPENIPNATWDIISAATIVDNNDDFTDWISSGIVDLSCIETTGYIAFKYVGSGDADFDGSYELDEIQINAN